MRVPVRMRAETVIVVVALLALIVVGVATYTAQSGPPTPYSSLSAAPDGTLGLYRWIRELGFQPLRLSAAPLRLAGVRALFVLEPQAIFSTSELAGIRRWVRDGGTLALLEDGGDPALPGAFNLAVQPLPGSAGLPGLLHASTPYGAAPVQPLLAHPPLRGLSVDVTAGVYGTARGVIPVLGNGGLRPPGAGPHARISGPDARNPALVYERVGRGRIYAGTTPSVLANGQIAGGDNRRLVLNLLAGLPAGSNVGFDDYHLVIAAATPATLTDALTSTGWGRALLYAMALVGLYIVLTGRRLGRPLREVPERGRSLAEYVISMAAIFRRAGLRGRVLALWQDDLRHHLAGTGGVRGRGDPDLVGEAARRAGLTPDEQNEALILLRPRASLGEGALVDLCGRIARLQQRLAGRDDGSI